MRRFRPRRTRTRTRRTPRTTHKRRRGTSTAMGRPPHTHTRRGSMRCSPERCDARSSPLLHPAASSPFLRTHLISRLALAAQSFGPPLLWSSPSFLFHWVSLTWWWYFILSPIVVVVLPTLVHYSPPLSLATYIHTYSHARTFFLFFLGCRLSSGVIFSSPPVPPCASHRAIVGRGKAGRGKGQGVRVTTKTETEKPSRLGAHFELFFGTCM
ncbi:hypothetical protein C8F04DRAFT_1115803 [Mycena alexandri]|uniref:Uncharacterized protein n=1 Tax=Mycena alexandri TaxID=1745969 RepID=A0AAD6SMA6_9AGAR|nr:hypothetical protein C8F04DRAFT_1115803 [Mycena alexandri]